LAWIVNRVLYTADLRIWSNSGELWWCGGPRRIRRHWCQVQFGDKIAVLASTTWSASKVKNALQVDHGQCARENTTSHNGECYRCWIKRLKNRTVMGMCNAFCPGR
jgi:hypothetical protein